ncbi:MAG TPA: hypothetical protein DEA08_37115 [Planctomycetes bacterium]|nr:hypothetical protein [Planctomycetota bacterium]
MSPLGPISGGGPLEAAPGAGAKPRSQAAEAAKKFEGLLLSQLLKSAFSGEASPFKGSPGAGVYEGFLETYLAEHLAEQGGFGFADQIAAQLEG